MRIPAQAVEVEYHDEWYPGTLHSWDVDEQGCASGVVSFIDERNDLHVGRFPEERIRNATARD